MKTQLIVRKIAFFEPSVGTLIKSASRRGREMGREAGEWGEGQGRRRDNRFLVAYHSGQLQQCVWG